MTDVVVPTLGESVTEATVGKWNRKAGDKVSRDEVLVELETDKVAVEITAPEAGVLADIVALEGTTVEIGALLARIGAGSGAQAAAAPPKAADAPKPKTPEPEPAKPAAPSAQRIAAENGIDVSDIKGNGRDGRVTKADALAAAEAKAAPKEESPPQPMSAPPKPQTAPAQSQALTRPEMVALRGLGSREERVKMTRLRQTIARRLKEAQNNAAMLTTFNEADMSAIMAFRSKFKDQFEKRHGVKLGFMSFFVKACVTALKEVPEVNAEIDGEDIIYKNFYDIGVAVGTEKGLVVPVLRDADHLSLVEIEKGIGELGARARDGKLKLEDLQGATFTISNGGVYGSLMSTPILNAPQSGILGMHKIQDRPMVVNGQVVARPMMYLALSYDHRLVDGKGAVTFLVRVKECLEDPERLLLEL
ncbi:MAG TPA: 2-oxoglutarate dehydrogenase complex dihydrolipoyllysine-residue succinyltransferase [Caulobacterales bacterium]|nr:2-oxoglutarate dehydrogenase complex dihydrolipoyllysine-residue succinyltransferase [Caulobacterales bacterium]